MKTIKVPFSDEKQLKQIMVLNGMKLYNYSVKTNYGSQQYEVTGEVE
jgi:hypothetical protein